MSRLFAFGCSFTSYDWPTWADILGKQFDYFQNWGRVGAGNSFIFNSLIECHVKNTITKEDVVGIMWTNVSREDRYVDYKWITPGNIYTQDIYDKNFVKNFADTRGYYIRDLALMYATKQMLTAIGCRYFFLTMMPVLNPGQYEVEDARDNVEDLLPYYKSVIAEIRPSVYEVIFNQDWWSRPYSPGKLDMIEQIYNKVSGPDWPTWQKFIDKNFQGIKKEVLDEIFDKSRWDWECMLKVKIRKDIHPCPNEHLAYFDKVLPEYEINSKTRMWVNQINDLLANDKKYTHLWQKQKIARW